MSTISREAIRRRLRLEPGDPGRLVVTPLLSEQQFSDASLDLRLGNQFIVFRPHTRGIINPFDLPEHDLRGLQERQVVQFRHKFVLHPGTLALACSFEYVRLPGDLEGQVEGRSSWARLGLQIATATCVEPGFSGVVTLELSNVGTLPLELYPGVRVAQLILREVSPPIEHPYQGRRKYRYPIGPEFSRLIKDDDALRFLPARDRRSGGG